MTDYGIYIAIGTLGLAVIAYAVKITLHVSRIEIEQSQYTDAQVDNLQREISQLAQTSQERTEMLRRDMGETGAALRTKIHETEMFARDTFVRKESFEMVVSRIEKLIEKMGDKQESRTDRLEGKLDLALERLQPRD